MPLSVNHPEADELAHAFAERMGETVDEAVVTSLRERLARTSGPNRSEHPLGKLLVIGRACAALPDYDVRSADEIVGYDENGLPR
jgi:antitoxin VapB